MFQFKLEDQYIFKFDGTLLHIDEVIALGFYSSHSTAHCGWPFFSLIRFTYIFYYFSVFHITKYNIIQYNTSDDTYANWTNMLVSSVRISNSNTYNNNRTIIARYNNNGRIIIYNKLISYNIFTHNDIFIFDSHTHIFSWITH